MNMSLEPSEPPSYAHPRPPHHVPPGTGTFGMYLFLASLTMLFGATLVGYIFMRINATAPAGALRLPWPLWISTFILLASSFTVHRALEDVRMERQRHFRLAMLLTLFLAALFVLVQMPSLSTLLEEHLHYYNASHGKDIRLYGLIFFLIAVHALHVVGGIIPMIVVTIRAQRGGYDHENHGPIKYMAMYWHFLDAVWLVMFSVLLLVR